MGTSNPTLRRRRYTFNLSQAKDTPKLSRQDKIQKHKKLLVKMLTVPRETYYTLLIFDRLDADWAREVHRYVSKRKQGKTYVMFRNSANQTLNSLDDLKLHYKLAGKDIAFLTEKKFKTGSDHEIVSNKVGANRKARKSAQRWIAEVNGDEPSVEDRKNMEEEAAVRKKAAQEAAKRRLEEKAIEKKKAEEEAIVKRKAKEEAAIRKLAEEEKRKAEEKVARIKVEEEVAAKRKAKKEATTLKKAEEEAAAALKRAKEETAALKLAEETAAMKKAEKENATLKKAEEETAALKKAEEETAALKKT